MPDSAPSLDQQGSSDTCPPGVRGAGGASGASGAAAPPGPPAIAPRALAAGGLQTRPMAMGARGAVSAPHQLASAAALEVLEAGGNAVDAAVAAAAASTVVQPFSSSLGGGGWAAVHIGATGRTEMLDFQGVVPAGLDPRAFRAAPSGLVDWPRLEREGSALLSCLVPAAVAGWEALLARHGSWSLSHALESAISLAAQGFPVSELLHANLAENEARLRSWPESAAIFLHCDRPYLPAQRLVQSDLAATLARVAAAGWSEIAEGETGAAIVGFHERYGGAVRAEDLTGYRPRWHDPLTGSFRGRVVHAAPAPLGDVSFLCGLQLLDAYPAFDGPLDPAYIHVSVESAKLIADERSRYLGPGTDARAAARLAGRDHVAELVQRIGERARPARSVPGGPGHTITLAVIDGEGNAVHLMQTVGTLFGCAAVAGNTGILLNSSLNFAYASGTGANRIVPGRGIEQNPCLAVVLDAEGRLEMLVGSPGGKTRVETVRQMLVNVLDFGMNLQQAVDAARFLAGASGCTVSFESRYGPPDPHVVAALEARGHTIALAGESFGSGQAAAVDATSGTRLAAADWRREAIALAC
ncbi:MAG TPA: gamma-glutamyltransferase [Acidimicrobiales bacterium]|nr:gamma-glutamyltransferase [Acidimicrobiales bacterium]